MPLTVCYVGPVALRAVSGIHFQSLLIYFLFIFFSIYVTNFI